MAGSPRRIFLSYTSELAEYPAVRTFVSAASDALARAGDAVAAMAYFTPREATPAAYCREIVRGCEVYVGLIGFRYGSPVRDQPEISYTELEFDEATEAGIPRLIFLLDENAPLGIPPARLFDEQADRQARQRAFRERLHNSGVTLRKITSPEQLELLLLQALQEPPKEPLAKGNGSKIAPSGEPAPEQKLLADYLNALLGDIRHLRPGRIKTFDFPLELVLDDIYIELQAAHERPDVDRRVTLEELAEARRQAEHWDWRDERDREQQLKLYAELDRSFRERDTPVGEPENLAAIVESHREVVILGDPGSGKTTLLKHLALKAAQAILAAPDGADLGSNRVPLYIRISEYAESRAKNDPELALGDYLTRYVSSLQLSAADQVAGLLRRLLDDGRCLVLLDGLDEVIDDGERVNVSNAIGQFAAVFRDRNADLGAPGNSFVVTSRIAGYRPFITLPTDFSEYTIRPMHGKQIERFLDRWCHAVERQILEGAVAQQIDEGAAHERDLVLDAISRSPGVRRLSENPLLLRILAMLHRSSGHLPQRRVEIYEEAADMLLYLWHLGERRTPKAAIDKYLALQLLGPVAMEIHTRWPSGFMSLGETEKLLCRLRGPQLGEPPEHPSIVREVRRFLKTVREHSGLFVERGNGLYGFMHLTFQEYFVARYLVSSRDKALDEIKARLHHPRWREPILLAVSAATDPFTHDIEEYLRAILGAQTEYEDVLHRDLLFAAECVGDSGRVPELLRREIARRLTTLYADNRGAGRYMLLQRQIRDALRVLNNSADSWAVHAALADVLTSCEDDASVSRVLELVELLQAGTQPVTDALQNVPNLHLLPEARRILDRAEARLRAEPDAASPRPAPPGWGAYQDDPIVASAVGALWLYGWRDLVELGLGVSDEMLREPAVLNVNSWRIFTRLRQLAWHLEACYTEPWMNPQAVIAELDAISRAAVTDLSDADNQDGQGIGQYLAQVRGWYEDFSVSIVQSNRLFAYILDIMTLDAAGAFDTDNPETIRQIAAELLSGLFALNREGQFPPAQRRRFRVKAARLAGRTGQANLQAQLFALVSKPVSGSDAREAFRRQLASVTRQLEEVLGTEIQLRIERWGRAVLQHAELIDAIAPTLVSAIRHAAPLLPVKDASGWRTVADAAGTAITQAAERLLSTGHNPRQYSEAAFLLARAGGQGLECVSADLDAGQPERCRLALRALRDPAVRKWLVTDGQLHARLIDVADRNPELRSAALNVLFELELSAESLAWCWARLREGSPWTRLIGPHLSTIQRVNGTSALLELLEKGLDDDATRPFAVSLLDRVTWVEGPEVYARYLAWLQTDKPELRHLAAFYLSSGDMLLGVPRDVAREATRSLLETMVRPLSVSWAALRGDPSSVRLLAALWAHGWRDGLVSILAELTIHPGQDVSDFHDGERVIRDLLGEARFGQALIPIITSAVDKLAELELERTPRPVQPHPSDVDQIKQQLLAELSTLAGEGPPGVHPPVPTPLRWDATNLLAALQGTPPRSPPPADVAAELWGVMADGSDDHDWFWAAARLAQLPAQVSRLQEELTAALLAGPHRRALALLLLHSNGVLRETMHDALQDRLRQQDLDERETLVIAGLLIADGCQVELPTALEHAAAASPAALAGEMLAAEPKTRMNAALGLLRADLPARLLPALVAVALTGSARLRWSGFLLLREACSALPTDGSTAAVGWLTRYAYETSYSSPTEGIGHAATVLTGATTAVNHVAPYWVLTWFEAVEHGSEADRRMAIAALQDLSQASDEVIGCLCTKLASAPGEAVRVRAALSMYELQRSSSQARSNPVFTDALVTALGDPAPRVRRAAALALRWTEHEAVVTGQRLLTFAREDTDTEARVHALVSLGRILRNDRQLQADGITDHHLFTEVRRLLSVADPLISRAAAAGIAAAAEARENSMQLLCAMLPDPHEVLAATLSGGADTDFWEEQPGGYHQIVADKIATWLHDQPTDTRDRMVDWMLSELEMAAAEMGIPDFEKLGEPEWTRRRIITAVLAVLSERLTHHSFAPTRSLDEVVTLFARTARDPDSYMTRLFSLRVLGNLQQFTPKVATAFFEACRDVPNVHQEPKAIIRKFKRFAPGSFRRLTAELFNSSNDALSAAHAATLLGELGLSRSEELGPVRRQEISAELVRFLRTPLAERTVVELEQTDDGAFAHAVGPLYDSVYEALVRVVAGPDAPAPEQAGGAPVAETVWQQHGGSPEELQRILERFEREGVPSEGEAVRPKISVIWRQGGIGDYRVSVYGAQASHRASDRYLQLSFQPGQPSLPGLDSVIIISRSTTSPPEHGTDPRAILDEPGARLLNETDLGSGDFIIAMPRQTIEEVSYRGQPDRTDVILKAAATAPLDPEDLIFRNSNDVIVSFPYWDDGIARASYALEDDRLNVLVTPTDEGLKLRDTDVIISRGGEVPIADESDIQLLRAREGIPDTRLTVSLPWQGQQAEKLFYELAGNFLHIIIRTAGPYQAFDLGDVRCTTSPISDDERDDSTGDQDDADDDEADEDDDEDDDEDGPPAESARPKISVFWREGQGEDYRVSVYGAQASHQATGRYLLLNFQARQDTVPGEDSLIVFSRGPALPGPQADLDAPGGRLLYETYIDGGDFIIAIPRPTIGEISYQGLADRTDMVLGTGMAPLDPADLIFRKSNDLIVSFPFRESGIAKVAYMLEAGRLNIIVSPSEEGLKLRDADVAFSRGAEIPAEYEADIQSLRAREGIPGTRFTVSLAWQEQQVEKVSYQLAGDFLHVIVRPVGPYTDFNHNEVRFFTSPVDDD